LLKALCYGRLSRDDRGADRVKIPDQLAQCRARAAELGAAVVAEHSDSGISGALDERHRPGLRAVLALAGSVDLVIVREQSRLARGEDLLGHVRTVLSRAGARVESVLEGQASDLERGVRAVIDAEYVRRCRELSRLKGRTRAARGERLGGRPTLGYRWDGNDLVIIPEDAELVRIAYRLALDGVSIRQIGLTMRWPFDRVSRILRSPWYAGDYVYGRLAVDPATHDQVRTDPSTWTIHLDHHPAIIPRPEWDRVQELLGSARGRWRSAHAPGTGSRLPLSGLLKCDICGGGMSVCGLSRPGPERWHYYSCFSAHHRHGCPGVGSVSVRGWVPRLLSAVAEVYADHGLPAEIRAELVSAPSSDAPRLEREVSRLLAAIRSGAVRDVSRLAAELDSAQDALDRARSTEERARSSSQSVPSVAVIRARLLALSRDLARVTVEPPPEIARQWLHRHVRRIDVSRESARVTIECGSVLEGWPGVSIQRVVKIGLVA
jgi:DNA invertase Pin-like site-specific DNA recombinase